MCKLQATDSTHYRAGAEPPGEAACRSLLMIMHNEDLLLVAITKWAANMLSKGVWGTITFTAVSLHTHGLGEGQVGMQTSQ